MLFRSGKLPVPMFVAGGVYTPVFANMFEFEMVSLTEFAAAIGLALLTIPVVEIVKFIQRKENQ